MDVSVLTISSRPSTLGSEKESAFPSVAQQGPAGASGPTVSASEVSVCPKLEAGWRVPGGRRAARGWAGAEVTEEPKPLPALASLPGPCL